MEIFRNTRSLIMSLREAISRPWMAWDPMISISSLISRWWMERLEVLRPMRQRTRGSWHLCLYISRVLKPAGIWKWRPFGTGTLAVGKYPVCGASDLASRAVENGQNYKKFFSKRLSLCFLSEVKIRGSQWGETMSKQDLILLCVWWT